jgi:Bacterial PH domain
MGQQPRAGSPAANGQSRTGLNGLAGRLRPGARRPGRRVFRLPGPVVVWWIWVVFAIANLVDLAFTGRDRASVVVVAVLLLITGLVYALAYRPRVIAGEDGIAVRNPFRDHWIPWGAVRSVVVGESVQVHCSLAPDTDQEKVVHSWGLYASRRSRVKSRAPARRRSVFAASAPPVNSKLPKEAQEMLKQSAAEHIAAELDLQSRMARQRGTPDGAWAGSWPWQPAAAVLIPAAALVIVLLVH